MKDYKVKYEHQVRLIARLREFAEKIPPGYINQKEFFITSLQNIFEHLMDLKREMLAEACGRFCAKLDQGAVTDESIVEFKSLLDKFISSGDFAAVAASMIGGKQLIKTRLSALRPLSIVDEEMKGGDRDKTADRLVEEAYKRLKFEELEKELMQSVNDPVIDRILTKARENVADYCCLYRVPLRDDDTLTPFSLSRIDAVVGACFRLIARIRGIFEKYK